MFQRISQEPDNGVYKQYTYKHENGYKLLVTYFTDPDCIICRTSITFIENPNQPEPFGISFANYCNDLTFATERALHFSANKFDEMIELMHHYKGLVEEIRDVIKEVEDENGSS